MHPYSSPVSDFTELRAPAQRRKLPLTPTALAKIEFRQRVLSLTEQAQLIEALGKCRNPLVLATVLLMLETHLPVHTLIHKIFWRDVNWERQTLQQDRHCFKNFKPRSISLSPAAIQILKDLGPGKPTEPILNITYPTFKRTFERAYHRSGVRGVPVNDLGQMPARMAAKLGVMISVVRQDDHLIRWFQKGLVAPGEQEQNGCSPV